MNSFFKEAEENREMSYTRLLKDGLIAIDQLLKKNYLWLSQKNALSSIASELTTSLYIFVLWRN